MTIIKSDVLIKNEDALFALLYEEFKYDSDNIKVVNIDYDYDFDTIRIKLQTIVYTNDNQTTFQFSQFERNGITDKLQWE